MIPVNTPVFEGNEKKYLLECIETGWISSEGPFVEKFETEFAKFVERKYAVSVSNGSDALDLAIYVLDLKAGDEVILPSFTIISCMSQILRQGLVPVFVDCDPYTFNMDVNSIEQLITKKTKAIIAVHIYGLPVEMRKLEELCDKYDLFLIEDAAEMHGQTYENKKCGSFGDLSTFSFYPNKHITTGEGGMIVTDCEQLYEKIKSLKNLGFQSERRFVHSELGWNMRLTNLQAAIGLAQLERIDEIVITKRKIGKQYNEKLNLLKFVQLPIDSSYYASNIYWVYPIVIAKECDLTALDVMNELAKRGVGTRPFFYPLHKQPVLSKFGYSTEKKLVNSEYIAEKGFYIPSGLGVTSEQIEYVSRQLLEIFN
jgi:perosamine synthetase